MNTMIAWFACNSVAANLLMVFIILMGANGIVNRLPVEVFPILIRMKFKSVSLRRCNT